ncbi:MULTISPECIES: RICIN domain-containing protein [unclassified Enterococcus]|uniref:RICIN domain-containing protein n=1 Tax=unclassified Enterococcus TaxID=2608891 RepID=UPI001A90DCB5|nr:MULTISPECIES: RICIN domain-containing protein [unclassified Enterococcus]MBO0461254.1 RICIN domain-containing protein [Enterococcus sp. DIV1298c]MBO1299746.1 RICIN domain-containing protein [Enterococcus sp. DIV1271a]
MKTVTKFIVGAFVATTLGVIGGSQTVSADLDPNIPGSNVGNFFSNKVVRIESGMDLGKALDWDQANLDQVIMYNNNGLWNQKWNMFYDDISDTYSFLTDPHQFNGFIKAASLCVSERVFDGQGNPKIATTGLRANWKLYRVGDAVGAGVYVLKNVESGKVLDLPNGNPYDAQGLVAREGQGTGTASQRFIIRVTGNL